MAPKTKAAPAPLPPGALFDPGDVTLSPGIRVLVTTSDLRLDASLARHAQGSGQQPAEWNTRNLVGLRTRGRVVTMWRRHDAEPVVFATDLAARSTHVSLESEWRAHEAQDRWEQDTAAMQALQAQAEHLAQEQRTLEAARPTAELAAAGAEIGSAEAELDRLTVEVATGDATPEEEAEAGRRLESARARQVTLQRRYDVLDARIRAVVEEQTTIRRRQEQEAVRAREEREHWQRQVHRAIVVYEETGMAAQRLAVQLLQTLSRLHVQRDELLRLGATPAGEPFPRLGDTLTAAMRGESASVPESRLWE